MLNSNERNELIQRFLAGEMRDEEIGRFQSLIKDDLELRRLLDEESGVEALLHDSVSNKVSDIRYSTIIDKAVGPVDVEAGNTKARTWLRVYAIAATLVIMVLGGYTLKSRFPAGDTSSTASVAQASHVSVRQNAKSITILDKDAVLVSEEGTKARVIKDADSVVKVVIAQGNAYFDVSSLAGSQVNVVTPHSAMSLQGTVFRVVVTELETEIMVLEGSVEVVHRNHLDSPQLLMAGVTGFADYRSLQKAETLAPEMCERRKSLLRTYIGWVQQQMNG